MILTKLKNIREQNQEEGFTLIELLVVILIIGILASIAVPMYLNNRKSAVDSTVKADVKNAATQVEAWIANKPTVITNIETSTAAGTFLDDINVSENNKLSIHGNSHGYCVQATNEGGADSKDGFKYESKDGIVKQGLCEGYLTSYSK